MQLGRVNCDLSVAQGTSINRTGRVAIRPDPAVPGRVSIGGQSHVLIEGTVTL